MFPYLMVNMVRFWIGLKPWVLTCNVNPGLINPVYGCLIGRVPLKYHIVTIWRVPPN